MVFLFYLKLGDVHVKFETPLSVRELDPFRDRSCGELGCAERTRILGAK